MPTPTKEIDQDERDIMTDDDILRDIEDPEPEEDDDEIPFLLNGRRVHFGDDFGIQFIA